MSAITGIAPALARYLNDHLSGAMAGSELASSAAERHEGTPRGRALAHLAREIEADKAILEELVTSSGIEPSRSRRAAGWIGEKLSRIPLGSARSSSDDPDDELRTLLELETLVMAMHGKSLLWSALDAAAPPEWADVNFTSLVHRAHRQMSELESLRQQAATAAFAPQG